VDLLLAGGDNQLRKLFPDWEQRARYVRYLIARYAGLNITWGGVENFEDTKTAAICSRKSGCCLRRKIPISTCARPARARHPRRFWMTADGFRDPGIGRRRSGAIEHQALSGAVRQYGFSPASPNAAGDAFRHRLWNAAMMAST